MQCLSIKKNTKSNIGTLGGEIRVLTIGEINTELYKNTMEGFPDGSVVKNNPPANAGDAGSTPSLGRSTGEGNGNPLQCSCLENLMGRGTWWVSSWSLKELHMIGD